MITQEKLKSLFRYNPHTGQFTRLVSLGNNAPAGLSAGYTKTNKGKKYRLIRIEGTDYPAHRLAYLYMNGHMPENQIDHIDGNGSNNTWKNLSPVTNQENARNRRLQSNNTSGVTGVRLRRGKWMARIKVDGIDISLKTSEDKFEAICARKSAEVKYKFHPNHGEIRPL